MPECRYCGDAFEDEASLLDHLREEHEGELSRIDRRRVADMDDDGGLDIPVGPAAIALVIAVSSAIVVYAVFFAGSGGSTPGAVDDVARTPTGLGEVHYHGTMNVTIDGERVDFSRSEYQLQDDAFHFEGGDGTRWHAHARGVTLEYAMATLGFGLTEGSVTVDETTFRDGEGASVTIEVNGEPVDPRSYVLQEGDHVRIVVRTG